MENTEDGLCTSENIQCKICVQRTRPLKLGHQEGRKENGPFKKPRGTLPSSGSIILYQLESRPGANNAEQAPTTSSAHKSQQDCPGCLEVPSLVLPTETQAQKFLSNELQRQERKFSPFIGKQV